MIKCNINDLYKLKDVIEKNNSEILDNLNKISLSYENNMSNNIMISEMLNYIDKERKIIIKKNNYYINLLNDIIKKYNDIFMNNENNY